MAEADQDEAGWDRVREGGEGEAEQVGMILQFFHRYAGLFAIMAGAFAYDIALSDDAPWWLKLAVGLPVTLVVYKLLYKHGVTRGSDRIK